MWKRGSQSSALNRAQALLVAKKNSRGDGQSAQGSPAKTQDTSGGFINARPTSPITNTLFSGLSDLFSEHVANPKNCTAPKMNQGRMDIGPQSSVGGEGSRFLKKASPPVTNCSQSPVSISHMQQMPDPRYVSPSHRGSQASVLRRLAQIESRIHSHLQPQEQARKGPQPAHNPIISLATPQKAVAQTLEASTLLSSAQSSNDQSPKLKRFLKNKVTTSKSSVDTGASVRVRSRAAAATTVPLRGVEPKSVKVDYGVSLESDEVDMLGDSLDSTDNSFLKPEKSPSVTKAEKMLSQKTHSTPPSAAAQHLSSNTAPLLCPGSPSHRSSPFRFTGQAQSRFSPSGVSPSPSPPCVSPSRSRRLSTPCRVDSSQQSICSMSGHSEAVSLEDLIPVQPASEDLHNVMSLVSSEDFKLNVMTLDELVPATSRFTEKMPRKQKNKHNLSVSGSPVKHEKRYRKAEQQQHKNEEDDMLDYQSDFESESWQERNYSASQVSEQLLGDGDEEAAALKVRDEASVLDLFHERTEDDYSDIFSDPSRSCMSQTSDTVTHNSDTLESLSRSRDSRSPVSHVNQTSSLQSDRHPAAGRVVKEAAVQTQPATYTWPPDGTTCVPVLGLTYMNPTSVAAHSLGADTVQAASTYNPTVFVLNEMLKHQLATTRQFIESSRHLHASLVRSLGPPNYRYTTLEETKEYIRMHRSSKLTMEEALKEVMQEIKEYKCTICD